MLLTILSFIFVLGVLITIHELGHFLVAKKVGIKVERFSIGFPPYIFNKKKGETDYSVGLIPLGGFVKMAGENPDEEATGAPYEFGSKTVGQRAAVIFAGPFMNYILALVIMIGIFMFSGEPQFSSDQVVVGSIIEGDPADKAGIQPDDIIIAINDHHVTNFDSLKSIVYKKPNEEITVTWVSGADTTSAPITTRIEEIPNLDGGIDTVGMIGFQQKVIGYKKFGFFESFKLGFTSTHMIVVGTVDFVQKLIRSKISSKLIGGPFFIAQQSGKEARKGPTSLFYFMALLSVNLAVLNVLPIPVLDGGHLVFLLVEKIKGSPVSIKVRMIAQQVGVVALLSLILYVTYNDILRLFN